ncbi:MAG: tellurium resistance protein [Paracoccaceae bacterium]|nr:tellurium resistance protein [Paracoccaceae bacterium]
MSRPPLPNLPPIPPRPGRFRQVPPAIFTPVFGFLGLGLAWRSAAIAFGLPEGLGEALLGAGVLLFAFAAFCYLAKLSLRPGVVMEDLRVLPGRGGLTAGSLSLFLAAAALVPYMPGLARGLMFGGLFLHAVLAVLYARALLAAPPEARAVTPVWQISFVGFIVAALPAVPLGHERLAAGLLYATIPVAGLVWAISLLDLARRQIGPPLRPLLAIHAAPAALFATVAASLGQEAVAAVFILLLLALLALLLGLARWITAAGFTPFWGAFTFPAAAAASACLAQGFEPLRMLGGGLLVGATLMITPILFRVMKLWAAGSLGPKSNVAIA